MSDIHQGPTIKYVFSNILAFDPAAAQAELNHFLACHHIRYVSREPVSHGERSTSEAEGPAG